MNDRLQLTPLEIAAGGPVGEEKSLCLPPPRSTDATARVAFEAAMLPALQREPCIVTLSGGRDSSAVLAVAVAVARREGLPLPVPLTVRFANAPGTGEERWQELVISHLDLDNWEVVHVDDELDLLGPVAQRILRRYGVLYPPSCPLYSLVLDRARGGSLLTGFGGDQILDHVWRTHWAEVLRGLDRPRASDLGGLVHLVAPRSVRRSLVRRHAPRFRWLRPAAQEELERLYVAGAIDEPARPGPRIEWLTRRRSLAAWHSTFELLAGDANVLAVHPLLDPGFLGAFTREGGWAGYGGRTRALRALCGDVLPDELVSRDGKAVFHYAYMRGPSRAFATRWTGVGLDPELVDPELLRQAWLGLMPNGHTLLALQTAWLASEGLDQREQEVAARADRVEPTRAT